MDLEQAIRTRRTHKAYRPEPVERATLDELFELARWAPNHHLTNPWRFRVLGAASLARLKAAADTLDAGSGAKIERAPTPVAGSLAHARGAALARGARRARHRRGRAGARPVAPRPPAPGAAHAGPRAGRGRGQLPRLVFRICVRPRRRRLDAVAVRGLPQHAVEQALGDVVGDRRVVAGRLAGDRRLRSRRVLLEQR